MIEKKKIRMLSIIFWAMSAIFVFIMFFLFVPAPDRVKQVLFPVAAVLGLVWLLLGIVLIVLASKSRLEKKHKVFLILMGASAVGVPAFAVLHNLVYGLMIILFGEGFWAGGDEAVLFILAVLVCPVIFIVGAAGSFVMWKKMRK